MPLVHPQAFEHVVFVIRVFLVETVDPLGDGGSHLRRVAFAKFQFGAKTLVVFGRFQFVQQGGDRLAVDRIRLHQWTTFVGHAVDTAVDLVAVRITQVVLQVTDDRVGPVEDVERTIRCDAGADRAEVLVARLQQVFLRLAFQAGTLFVDLHAEDALEADDVQVEERAIPFIREMPARKHLKSSIKAFLTPQKIK